MPENDDKGQGARESRERQNGRARAVQRAAEQALARGGPYVAAVPEGTVTIERVELCAEGDVEWVEVWLGGDVPDPHFRIYNAPTLAQDPAGDIERNGRRYRQDPMLAVAQVIGQNGGAEQQRKVRGRRGMR